jgi:hypothetical protein
VATASGGTTVMPNGELFPCVLRPMKLVIARTVKTRVIPAGAPLKMFLDSLRRLLLDY